MTDAGRPEPLLPNAWIVARREYGERIHSRMFYASTLFLAAFAILVAFAPLFFKALDQTTTTRVAVVAAEDQLAERAIATMSSVLNSDVAGAKQAKPYQFVRILDVNRALEEVFSGRLEGAVVADRGTDGKLDFTFYTGEGMAADRTQFVSVGTLAVAILDWTANNTVTGQAFQMPGLDIISAAGPNPGGAPISSSDFAGRRIVAIVLLILIFMIVVIYGMWVAAGVVAEKTSRVMELIVAAASAKQLLVGKVVGIGAAGLTQYVAVLLAALGAIVIEDRVAEAMFGPGNAVAPSLVALTPGLLAAYAAFFAPGFTLSALIYAAAGSLVSRPEELQTIALPLSIIAITGYLQAALALTGGSVGFIKVASFIPFWSPFVMLTRLTVSRVEPWEIALSFGILIATIVLVLGVAIRVYAAGVLLYGQKAGLRTIVRAVRQG